MQALPSKIQPFVITASLPLLSLPTRYCPICCSTTARSCQPRKVIARRGGSAAVTNNASVMRPMRPAGDGSRILVGCMTIFVVTGSYNQIEYLRPILVVPHSFLMVPGWYILPHCIVLYCIVLYCIVLSILSHGTWLVYNVFL